MNKNETGRTMLEMLGVIAILGIIIYGALNGINSGMTSYKINQVYSDVSTAVKEIQNMYLFMGNDYRGINLPDLRRQNIRLENPFGEGESISGSEESFSITYTISNGGIRDRLKDLDWDQVSVNCSESGSNLVFSPK